MSTTPSPTPLRHAVHRVPQLALTASAIALCVLLTAGALVVGAAAFDRLRLVVVPVLIALLACTMLVPVVDALERRGLHRGVATLVALAGALGLLGAVLTAVVPPFLAQTDDVAASASGGIERVRQWVSAGPFGIEPGVLDGAMARVEEEVRSSGGQIGERAWSGALMLIEVIAGALLGMAILFFLLRDGRRIRDWALERAGGDRARLERKTGAAWGALAAYVRGVSLVALVEGTLVLLALVIIGVPLALPIAVLAFFGAYIPVVGAFAVGAIAVLVALFTGGPVTAGVVLVAFVVIQQVESNVLHPVIVGRATEVHPLAILLGVTAGGILAGIVGALLAPPALAVAQAVTQRDGSDLSNGRVPSPRGFRARRAPSGSRTA